MYLRRLPTYSTTAMDQMLLFLKKTLKIPGPLVLIEIVDFLNEIIITY